MVPRRVDASSWSDPTVTSGRSWRAEAPYADHRSRDLAYGSTRATPIRQLRVTQPTAVLCRLCVRLFEQRAILLLEYHAALDALDATAQSHPTYAARWAELSRLSERLDEAGRLDQRHQENHRGS